MQIALIGDSIVARLPRQTSNFTTTAYRGATTEKIETILFNEEDENIIQDSNHIILAFGTNNLQKQSPTQIVTNLIFGAQLFQGKHRRAEIYIATLIRRRDKRDLDNKIPEINRLLKKKCPKLGVGIFDINNTFERKGFPVDDYHYYDGLHLSAVGLKKYQQSLNNFAFKVNNRAK